MSRRRFGAGTIVGTPSYLRRIRGIVPDDFRTLPCFILAERRKLLGEPPAQDFQPIRRQDGNPLLRVGTPLDKLAGIRTAVDLGLHARVEIASPRHVSA
jgi:hypothetical protein